MPSARPRGRCGRARAGRHRARPARCVPEAERALELDRLEPSCPSPPRERRKRSRSNSSRRAAARTRVCFGESWNGRALVAQLLEQDAARRARGCRASRAGCRSPRAGARRCAQHLVCVASRGPSPRGRARARRAAAGPPRATSPGSRRSSRARAPRRRRARASCSSSGSAVSGAGCGSGRRGPVAAGARSHSAAVGRLLRAPGDVGQRARAQLRRRGSSRSRTSSTKKDSVCGLPSSSLERELSTSSRSAREAQT